MTPRSFAQARFPPAVPWVIKGARRLHSSLSRKNSLPGSCCCPAQCRDREGGESQPCHPVGTRKGQDGHSLAHSAFPWGSASTGGNLRSPAGGVLNTRQVFPAKCPFKCVKVLNKEADISFSFFCIFGKTDKTVMKGFSVFNLVLQKQPETPKFEGKLPNTSQSFPLTNKIKN